MMNETSLNRDCLDTMQTISAAVAHEIRNPLSLAQASLDCISLDDADKKYVKFCGLIKNALQRIAEIITAYDDIFTSEPSEERITAYKFISEIVDGYEAVNPNIQFNIVCPDEGLTFTSNRKKLEIVLSNVVKNAVEAVGKNDPGKIEIHFKKEDGRDILACTDNGCGICREALDKLDNGVRFTTKDNGHGLGLSICKWLMSDLGGSLTLENHADGGCVVIMTIDDNRYERALFQ